MCVWQEHTGIGLDWIGLDFCVPIQSFKVEN